MAGWWPRMGLWPHEWYELVEAEGLGAALYAPRYPWRAAAADALAALACALGAPRRGAGKEEGAEEGASAAAGRRRHRAFPVYYPTRWHAWHAAHERAMDRHNDGLALYTGARCAEEYEALGRAAGGWRGMLPGRPRYPGFHIPHDVRLIGRVGYSPPDMTYEEWLERATNPAPAPPATV